MMVDSVNNPLGGSGTTPTSHGTTTGFTLASGVVVAQVIAPDAGVEAARQVLERAFNLPSVSPPPPPPAGLGARATQMLGNFARLGLAFVAGRYLTSEGDLNLAKDLGQIGRSVTLRDWQDAQQATLAMGWDAEGMGRDWTPDQRTRFVHGAADLYRLLEDGTIGEDTFSRSMNTLFQRVANMGASGGGELLGPPAPTGRAEAPPTVSYTPPVIVPQAPPEPTVNGSARLTLGGSAYTIENTSEGFRVTNADYGFQAPIRASSLDQARDILKGAWLAGQIPGPTPSESPLTIANQRFSIVGNNGTYGLRDPAGELIYQLPGRTLAEAAEAAHAAYFTDQIPGFPSQDNPLTLGGQRLNITGSHGDYGLILPDGSYGGRFEAGSLAEAAGMIETAWLDGVIPGMTPPSRTIDLGDGATVRLVGGPEAGAYGIADTAGELLTRILVENDDGTTRNPASSDEAEAVARNLYRMGGLADLGLAPPAATTSPGQGDDVVLYGADGRPLPPSSAGEDEEETPAAGGDDGGIDGGNGNGPVVGTGGPGDEDDPDWNQFERDARFNLEGKGFSQQAVERLVQSWKAAYQNGVSISQLQQRLATTTPNLAQKVNQLLENPAAARNLPFAVAVGTALLGVGTWAFLGFANLFPENVRSFLTQGRDMPEVGDTMVDEHVLAGVNAVLSAGYPNMDELLRDPDGTPRDFTDEAEYQAAIGEIQEWKQARAQQAVEVMVGNMAVLQAEVGVLIGSEALADFARRLTNPSTIGVADVQGLLGIGGLGTAQQITTAAHMIQVNIAMHGDAALGIINAQRDSQLAETRDQSSAQASAETAIVTSQIERVGDLLARGPGPAADIGTNPSVAQLRVALEAYRSFVGELGAAQRQIQDTLDALPDGFDAAARQQLVDARNRLQDRVDAIAGQVTTLTFQIDLLQGNEISRNTTEVNREVDAGRRAVDLWNGRFDTAHTLSEFPSIKAPINSATLFDLVSAVEDLTGRPFDAGSFPRLAQAPMVELLNEQNPDWVLQIAPGRDAPYTEAEAQALRDEALGRAQAGDAANGRDIVVPVEVWREILSGRRQSSSDADFTIPGLVGDVVAA